jgi:hypothetical protein
MHQMGDSPGASYFVMPVPQSHDPSQVHAFAARRGMPMGPLGKARPDGELGRSQCLESVLPLAGFRAPFRSVL